MNASIIIPLYNRWDLTAECLAAISATTPWATGEVEVILVDNGSTDATASMARADVVVRNYTNRGFATACNQGAGVARHPNLVFLNNDTVPLHGWLDPLVEALDAEEADIIGSRLVFADGRIQHAGVTLSEVDGILTAANLETEEPTRDVPAVTGACLAIRATAFAGLGGFDAGFWNGYEDVDLCLRCGALDGKVRYCATSNVIHYASASGPERWSAVQQNIDRLQEKWKAGWYNSDMVLA